jgi:hypothetical protein
LCELISHTAVCEDIARIVRGSQEICQPFREALTRQMEYARFGCLTRSVPVADTLDALRPGWDARRREENREKILAYVLGHVCHMPADKILNPLNANLDRDTAMAKWSRGLSTPSGPDAWPGRSKQYQDLFLFKTVYENGQRPPFSPAFFAPVTAAGAKGFNVEAVEELFRVLVQRAFLSLHHYLPDTIERINRLPFQPCYVSAHDYAEAYRRPDHDQYRTSITEVNFYDREDALIRLVRGIQRGDSPEAVDREQALAAATDQSLYAQVLALGYGYIHAASEYWRGTMTRAQLSVSLPEGQKPGDRWEDRWDFFNWKVPVTRAQRGFL